jgi:hypothetical protein
MTTKAYSIIRGGGAATTYPPNALTQSYVFDDFLGGGSSTYDSTARHHSIGELGWVLADTAHNAPNGDALPQNGIIDDDENHPGVLMLLTAGASSDRAALHLGLGAGFPPNKTFSLRWVFRLEPDTSPSGERVFQIGAMYTSSTPATNDTPGFHLSHNSNNPDTTWWARWFDDSNVLHEVNTGLALDSNWHLLNIQHTEGSTDLRFYLDDALVATITSFDHADLTVRVNGFADCWADGTLYLDYYDCLVEGLTRYTPA